MIEAINGEQAIEVAVRERPDLLLIDLNMPVMDGYQAIHFLRGHFKMTALPIIVITAEDGQSVERRVLALGANDYIIKPYRAGGPARTGECRVQPTQNDGGIDHACQLFETISIVWIW